jgi:hypothetical protein
MLKIASIALTIAIFLALGGGSSGKPRGHIDPSNPSTQSQQSTNPDQRGTEQSPFVVKVIPTPPTPEEANHLAAQESDKSNADWWLVKFNGGLVLVGVLQLVVFGLVFGFQGVQLKRTVVATKQSADALISVEAATLFVFAGLDTVNDIAKAGFWDKSESMWDHEINRPGISYFFKNIGRSGAIIREISERVVASENIPEIPSLPTLREALLDEMVVEPTMPSSTYVATMREKFTIGDAVKFQKEKLDIWFYGYVRYDDIFKRRHKLRYLFRFHRGYERFRLIDFEEAIESKN